MGIHVRTSGLNRRGSWLTGALAKISFPMIEVGANGVPALLWSKLLRLPDPEHFLGPEPPRASRGVTFIKQFGSLPLIFFRKFSVR